MPCGFCEGKNNNEPVEGDKEQQKKTTSVEPTSEGAENQHQENNNNHNNNNNSNSNSNSNNNCCSCGDAIANIIPSELKVPGRISGEVRNTWFTLDTLSSNHISSLRLLFLVVVIGGYLAVLLTAALQFNCSGFCDLKTVRECSFFGVETPSNCIDFNSTFWESSDGIRDITGHVFKRNRRIVYWQPGLLVDNVTFKSFSGAVFEFRNSTGSIFAHYPANLSYGGEFLTMRLSDDFDIPPQASRIAIRLQQQIPYNTSLHTDGRNSSLTFMLHSETYITAEIALRYVFLTGCIVNLVVFIVKHATRDQVAFHLENFAFKSFVKDYIVLFGMMLVTIIFCDPLIAPRYLFPGSKDIRYWSDHFVYLFIAVFAIFTSTFVTLNFSHIASISSWKTLLKMRSMFVSLFFATWYIILDSIAYINDLEVSQLLFGFQQDEDSSAEDLKGFSASLSIFALVWFIIGCIWVFLVIVLFWRNKDRVFYDKERPAYRGKTRMRFLAFRLISTLCATFGLFYFAVSIPVQVTFSSFVPVLGRTALADVFTACCISNIALWCFNVTSHRGIIAPPNSGSSQMSNYLVGGDPTQVILVDEDDEDDEQEDLDYDLIHEDSSGSLYYYVNAEDDEEESDQEEDNNNNKKKEKKKEGEQKKEEEQPKQKNLVQEASADGLLSVSSSGAGSTPNFSPAQQPPQSKNNNKKEEGDEVVERKGSHSPDSIAAIDNDDDDKKEKGKEQQQVEKEEEEEEPEEHINSLDAAADAFATNIPIIVTSASGKKAKVKFEGEDEEIAKTNKKKRKLIREKKKKQFQASVGTAQLRQPGKEPWTKANFQFLRDNCASGFFFATEAEKIEFDSAHSTVPYETRSFFVWETACRMLSLSEAVYYEAPEEGLYQLVQDDIAFGCCLNSLKEFLDSLMCNTDLQQADEEAFDAASRKNDVRSRDARKNRLAAEERRLEISQYDYQLLEVSKINEVQVVIALFAPKDSVGPTMASKPGKWAPNLAPFLSSSDDDEEEEEEGEEEKENNNEKEEEHEKKAESEEEGSGSLNTSLNGTPSATAAAGSGNLLDVSPSPLRGSGGDNNNSSSLLDKQQQTGRGSGNNNDSKNNSNNHLQQKKKKTHKIDASVFGLNQAATSPTDDIVSLADLQKVRKFRKAQQKKEQEEQKAFEKQEREKLKQQKLQQKEKEKQEKVEKEKEKEKEKNQKKKLLQQQQKQKGESGGGGEKGVEMTEKKKKEAEGDEKEQKQLEEKDHDDKEEEEEEEKDDEQTTRKSGAEEDEKDQEEGEDKTTIGASTVAAADAKTTGTTTTTSTSSTTAVVAMPMLAKLNALSNPAPLRRSHRISVIDEDKSSSWDEQQKHQRKKSGNPGHRRRITGSNQKTDFSYVLSEVANRLGEEDWSELQIAAFKEHQSHFPVVPSSPPVSPGLGPSSPELSSSSFFTLGPNMQHNNSSSNNNLIMNSNESFGKEMSTSFGSNNGSFSLSNQQQQQQQQLPPSRPEGAQISPRLGPSVSSDVSLQEKQVSNSTTPTAASASAEGGSGTEPSSAAELSQCQSLAQISSVSIGFQAPDWVLETQQELQQQLQIQHKQNLLSASSTSISATSAATAAAGGGSGSGDDPEGSTTEKEKEEEKEEEEEKENNKKKNKKKKKKQEKEKKERKRIREKPKRIAHLCISFRGTTTSTNHAVNLDFGRAVFNEMLAETQGTALVHEGFMAAWDSMREQLFASLDKYLTQLGHRKFPIILTGHSQGAGIASLCAYSLRKEFPTHPVSVYSYGMPRIGNSAFREAYDAAVPDSYRVRCENDFVSHLRHCNRVHVGREVVVDRDGNWLVEPNGLEKTYRPLDGAGSGLTNHTLGRYANAFETIFRKSVRLPFKTFLTTPQPPAPTLANLAASLSPASSFNRRHHQQIQLQLQQQQFQALHRNSASSSSFPGFDAEFGSSMVLQPSAAVAHQEEENHEKEMEKWKQKHHQHEEEEEEEEESAPTRPRRGTLGPEDSSSSSSSPQQQKQEEGENDDQDEKSIRELSSSSAVTPTRRQEPTYDEDEDEEEGSVRRLNDETETQQFAFSPPPPKKNTTSMQLDDDALLEEFENSVSPQRRNNTSSSSGNVTAQPSPAANAKEQREEQKNQVHHVDPMASLEANNNNNNNNTKEEGEKKEEEERKERVEK